MIKNNIKGHIKAFSLAEILLSVTIVAIILLLAMPAITKKSIEHLLNKESGHAEFYFNKADNKAEAEVLPCYVTTITGITTTSIQNNTGDCQSYKFTIPNGVHKIDMTLVAGGGGGGGAGGGQTYTGVYKSGDSNFSFSSTRLKSAVINVMTGAGTDGEGKGAGDDAAGSSRKGGNSGTAIIDFNIPKDFILSNYAIDFLYADYNATNISDYEKITADFNVEDTYGNITADSSTPFNVPFKGKGLKFTGRLNDGTANTYTSLLAVSDAVTNSFLNTQIDAEEQTASYHSRVLCGTNATADPANANVQIFQGKDLSDSSLVTSTLCKLNPISYKASVDGRLPQGLPSTDEYITSGKISPGGKGGDNASAFADKGNGGDGASLVYLCFNSNGAGANNCKWSSSTNVTSSIKDTKAPGGRYNQVTFTIEQPPAGGAGGAGGGAVKINNFKVTPGKTYTVVVGKGGAGGAKGYTGTAPTAGNAGTSGSSTAIYDENDNLILMVIGGVGGAGGKVPNVSGISNSKSPSGPTATRYVPMVIMGTEYESLLTFDDKIAETAEIIAADNTNISVSDIANSTKAKRLIYNYMKNVVQPLFTLSINNSQTITNPNSVNYATYYEGSDRKTGGFVAYTAAAINNDTAIKRIIFADSTNQTQKHKGQDISFAYSGFYFRYPVNNSFYYAGGLGGFSGLGSKTGCGGSFLGNYDGLKLGTDGLVSKIIERDSRLVNTIAMMKKTGSYEARFFNMDEYLEGCTPSTTNGHSATFKAPVISNGKIENFGQAGAGGGGGGYNIDLGSGNGGDGQNGYAVITWKK